MKSMRSAASMLFLASVMVASSASAQIITTIAGTIPTLPASGAALNVPLGFLSGVAVDVNGNIYASDETNNVVVQISPAGNLAIVAGNGLAGFSGDGGPAASASLRGPIGVAVDAAGNLYIADTGNDAIRKVSNGIITTVVGSGQLGFSGDGGPATSASLNVPQGVAIDAAGNLYIGDTINNRVRKVSGGIITTVAGNGQAGFSGDGGPATSAMLNSPKGMAIDAAGNLYIADGFNNRIRKVSDGTISTVAGDGQTFPRNDGGPATSAGLSTPFGVALDATGNLYISDAGNAAIRKVSGGMISTVAGSGTPGFSGDGGSATSARLSTPFGVAVDGSGNLYIADSNNSRVRQVSGGNITTVAGNGLRFFAGDGGPATSAALNSPSAVAIDASGNLYIADTSNRKIRKVSNGIITTFAGNGAEGATGDGGAATSAELFLPKGVAIDAAGNLYIADNSRIRKVSGGIITTVAGNGQAGFSGDGGPATSAQLSFQASASVAVDAAGNLYIADTGNNRIRKVSGGTITTVAGNGQAGFSGDGGAATSAMLNAPQGVAVDAAGNLYIADSANERIRKVAGGTITTIAGSGQFGFTGDNGPATSATLDLTQASGGVAVDAAGNVYLSGIAEVRKVSGELITKVAGAGMTGFSGDGGPATSAALYGPLGVAVDAAGNVYIADTSNNRIRKVLAAASYQVSPTTLSYSTSGGSLPVVQSLGVSSSVTGLAFNASTSAPWLSVSPGSGTLPTQLQVTVDPSQLMQGTYQGTVTISVPNGTPASTSVPVTVMVGSSVGAPSISANPTSLNFSFTQGAGAGNSQLTIATAAPAPFPFTVAASTTTGGTWLQVSSTGGSVTAASPATLTVTATPGTLAVGTYSGAVTINSATTGQIISIPVTMAITAPPQTILLSQTGFTFTAVAQGGTVLPQTLGILNTGSGVLNYTASANTLPPVSGWLSVSPASGTVNRPFLDVSFVNVIVDASSLTPGTYYGRVQVSAAGASNSPQTALVVLTVLPAGSNPGPDVRPTGLVFTGVAGAENPGSQSVTIANVTANPINFQSGLVGAGIQYLPTDATISPESPTQIVVQPDFSKASAGVSHAALTLLFDDGTIQPISLLSVVAPPGTAPAAVSTERSRDTSGCAPSKLIPQFTQVGFVTNANVTVGFPATVSAKIVDDCGGPMTSGSVVVSFSNGDPPLSLNNLQDGNWIASWQPTYASAGVVLSLRANERSGVSGSVQSSPVNALQASQNLPLLSGAPESVGTLTAGAFAPGDLVLIKGSGLADGQAASTSTPLAQQLAGASIVVGGLVAPLLYADASQVVALIPSGVPVNSSQEVVVQRDNLLGIPAPLIIATTHPAILTSDGSGQGQGLIYKDAGGVAATLADAGHTVNGGDTVIIYCTGLGATDANGNATNKVAVSIGGQAAQVIYAGVALSQNYPSGGAPMLLGLVSGSLGGLYQVTATVPSGVSGSHTAVSISSAGQISQPGVTFAASGAVNGVAPVISGAFTSGGFPDIAQNDWIEIHGTNLAPSSVGPGGMTWDNAPDFASGRLPAQLGGVTVTVDSKPAFTYFVSANQVNVLTPLDSALGPVQIVVTSGGIPSAPFQANLRPAAPSFPRFGGKYVVAEHADYSLLGTASLSIPGFTFTPAKPGETILLYAFGFGLPATTLTNGSSSQFGPLPATPSIQIGGLPATVAAAYLISPGLYQFNVVVPTNAPDGDNSVTCTYMGQTAPVGALLTIQH